MNTMELICIIMYIYLCIIERFFKFRYNSSSSLIVDMFCPSGTPQYENMSTIKDEEELCQNLKNLSIIYVIETH